MFFVAGKAFGSISKVLLKFIGPIPPVVSIGIFTMFFCLLWHFLLWCFSFDTIFSCLFHTGIYIFILVFLFEYFLVCVFLVLTLWYVYIFFWNFAHVFICLGVFMLGFLL